LYIALQANDDYYYPYELSFKKRKEIMRKIPSTMSTQHPDNVTLPSWVNGDIIAGEDEVR